MNTLDPGLPIDMHDNLWISMDDSWSSVDFPWISMDNPWMHDPDGVREGQGKFGSFLLVNNLSLNGDR